MNKTLFQVIQYISLFCLAAIVCFSVYSHHVFKVNFTDKLVEVRECTYQYYKDTGLYENQDKEAVTANLYKIDDNAKSALNYISKYYSDEVGGNSYYQNMTNAWYLDLKGKYDELSATINFGQVGWDTKEATNKAIMAFDWATKEPNANFSRIFAPWWITVNQTVLLSLVALILIIAFIFSTTCLWCKKKYGIGDDKHDK